LLEETVIIRRLVVPLAFAVALYGGRAVAQDALPAPLAGQAGPTASPLPPTNEASPSIAARLAPSPGAPDVCMKEFLPLREEAVLRGKLVVASGGPDASPAVACRMIGNYGQSEIGMIKYIEANAAKCGFPQSVAEQLKASHKNTEGIQNKICAVAQQAQSSPPPGSRVLGVRRRAPGAPVGDFPPYYGSRKI
jgi:hypothetical protein